MWQGLTGGAAWVFCSTPPIGATFRSGRYMDWPSNDQMIGDHRMCLWAWNVSGIIERAPFFITVNPPAMLAECKFGALTLAGAGKINTNKIPGGPLLAASSPYVGAWGSFTVDSSGFMSPTTATLVAGSYTIGTLSIPIVIVAGEYTVSSEAEAIAAGNAAGGFSGKTIRLRGHASTGATRPITITTSNWQDKFNALASLCTLAAADKNDRPCLERFAIFAVGNTPNNLTLDGLAFYRSSPLVDRNSGAVADGSKYALTVQNGATNCRVVDCEFMGNWDVGRLNNQRCTNRWYMVNVNAAVGLIVEGCRFAWCFSPYYATQSAYNCVFRYNTTHMFFDDAFYAEITDTAGNTANFNAYGNYSAHMIGDSGFHADAMGQVAPQRAAFDNTGTEIWGNITNPGWECLMGYPWATVADMPAAATIQTTTSYSPAFLVKHKAEMTPGVGNNITLTLPSLVGLGAAWVTATAYIAGDVVRQGGKFYRCTTGHTSAAAFATDLAANNWSESLSCVQKMGRGGTVTVVTAGGETMAYTGHGNPVSITMVQAGMFFRLTPNPTTDKWGVNQEFKATQGSFTNNPVTGGKQHINPKIHHNIFQSTTKPFSWTGATGGLFVQNWALPMYPGDPFNNGTPNDYLAGFDVNDDHQSLWPTTGNTIAGNVFGPYFLNLVAQPNDVLNEQMWLNSGGKSLAAIAAQFPVQSTLIGLPNTFVAMSLGEAIQFATPIAGSDTERRGHGPGLGITPADDSFKFTGCGKIGGGAFGFVNNKPWKVIGFTVSAISGGFKASWNPPGYLGAGAITNYKLEYRVNGGSWIDLAVGTALSGFWENGAALDSINVRITAENANGPSHVSLTWPTPIVVSKAKSAQVPSLTLLHAQNFPAAGNGGNTSQYETTVFTPSGLWPLLVLVNMRSNPIGGAAFDSATIGAAGRGYGTGTALVQSASAAVPTQHCNSDALYIGLPSATPQTIQLDFSLVGNGCHIEVFEVVNGAVVLIGATAVATGTGATSRAVTIPATQGSKSLIAYVVTSEVNNTITYSDTMLYDRSPGGGGQINAACSGGAMTEAAVAFGSFTGTFTLSTSSGSAAVAVELLGAP